MRWHVTWVDMRIGQLLLILLLSACVTTTFEQSLPAEKVDARLIGIWDDEDTRKQTVYIKHEEDESEQPTGKIIFVAIDATYEDYEAIFGVGEPVKLIGCGATERPACSWKYLEFNFMYPKPETKCAGHFLLAYRFQSEDRLTVRMMDTGAAAQAIDDGDIEGSECYSEEFFAWYVVTSGPEMTSAYIIESFDELFPVDNGPVGISETTLTRRRLAPTEDSGTNVPDDDSATNDQDPNAVRLREAAMGQSGPCCVRCYGTSIAAMCQIETELGR
jgi:hypothetical protein